MNRLNLRQRLLLLSLLPSAIIAITLVSYFTLSGIRTLEVELRSKAQASVRYLAQISEYGIISGQVDSLHGLAQAIIQDSGVKAAVIVNPKGRTLAVSGRVSLTSDILRSPLASPGEVSNNEHWVAFGAPVLRTVSEADLLFDPLSTESASGKGNEVIGHVFIEFDKSDLALRQRELLMRGLLIVFLGLVVIAALAIAMADNLARPIRRLVDAVGKMSAGQLDTRVPQESSAEFGILEQGFNEMAGRIEEVHASMQNRIEEATALLAFQARHDPLTGLLNRREFEARLEKTLAGIQAGSEESSLLFIDLDRFKPVNDTCGHLAGDELLRQIAQLFQGRLREEDTLARLGGDEFGIILANCVGPRARQVADDLCALTGAYRFIWQDKVFTVGASIGLTPLTRRVRNIKEVLATGDAACYRAKETGRNQVCEQETESPQERRQGTGNWATRIGSALAENRLIVEAMPLLGLQATAMSGHCVELTARLHEPGQLPVALNAIQDAAERNDLALNIDLLFLETSIDALARSAHRQPALTCLIPLSAMALEQPKIIDLIAGKLAAQHLSGRGLILLFREEVVLSQQRQFAVFAQQVRSLGCQIGLDDFGGSLSSFSQLRTISPSMVKLSHSLTRDLGDNPASTALLRAVQEITADQGVYSIATDVNDPTTLPRLQALGLDYAQGAAVGPCEPFAAWFEGVVMRKG